MKLDFMLQVFCFFVILLLLHYFTVTVVVAAIVLLFFVCFEKEKKNISFIIHGYHFLVIFFSPNADTRPESVTKNTPEEVTEKQKTIEDSEKTSR